MRRGAITLSERIWHALITTAHVFTGRWTNCRVEEHGLSWKQLFFERNLQEELESFGSYPDVTRAHEDAMVRPPIDSTHSLWKQLYQKLPPRQPDGKPMRERFCKYGANCDAVRIARAPSSGWPSLERLKPLVVPAVEEFESHYAWSTLPREEVWGVAPAAAATAQRPASPPREEGEGDGEASERGGVVADSSVSQAGLVGEGADPDAGEPEADCDHNVLREYVTPEELAEFQVTGEWPDARKPCLLCLRAEHLSTFVQHLEASEDSVFSLRCTQVPSHLDWEIVFTRLPNLASAEITYGLRRVGMKYDRSMLGMKMNDSMSLAKCIKATETLASLSLPSNMIDDDTLRMLVTGLSHNQTVTHLDLSHNKVSSLGAHLLAKLLGPQSVLMSLDISDNHIQSDGGRYLGRALRINDSLMDLNLRLNRLEDYGGMQLMEGLVENRSLTSLNLAANGVGSETGQAFSRFVGDPSCGLVALDLSCNELSERDAETILRAMRENASLTSIDLRSNASLLHDSAAVDAIVRITRRNELALRSIMRRT